MKRTELKRVTPLKPRSRKMQQAYNVYLPLRKAFLEANPVCQRCRFERSVDVHHVKSRARGCDLTNSTNWAAFCRVCHSWLEHPDHARQAEAEGFLLHSWDEEPQ